MTDGGRRATRVAAEARWNGHGPTRRDLNALPNVVVIGAMKCGTTSLHEYLARHPDVSMAAPKELNFFFGPTTCAKARSNGGHHNDTTRKLWALGNAHRGLEWYVSHFDARVAVRGESSPGYTSPSHPGVAADMADVIPSTRLIYLIRDPVERALSQYEHHRREGTEIRPPDEALLDTRSQYVSRSCYWERLQPFLRRFARDRIAIVAVEDLERHRRSTMREVFRFLDVDDDFWCDDLDFVWHALGRELREIDPELRARLEDAMRDDADRMRELAGRDFPWSV